MAVLRVALVSCLLLAGASAALAAEDKIDKDKLVGTWTLAKTTATGTDAPPPGAVIKVTFTRDGKVTTAMTFKDKTQQQEGSYTVKGDQLTTVLKGPGGREQKDTVTIKEVTGTKLVVNETSRGKTVTTEFKK
jgi:uncharacterized protein (TIGR03066 family)